MKAIAYTTATMVGVVTWLAGISLAKGMWSTAFATYIPPYAWYLVANRILEFNGWK